MAFPYPSNISCSLRTLQVTHHLPYPSHLSSPSNEVVEILHAAFSLLSATNTKRINGEEHFFIEKMFSFLFYVFYEYWQSWLWYIQGERSDLEEESSWFNRKILSGNIEAHESITQTGYRKGWRAALQILSLGPAWLLIPPAGLGTCHSAGHGEPTCIPVLWMFTNNYTKSYFKWRCTAGQTHKIAVQ